MQRDNKRKLNRTNHISNLKISYCRPDTCSRSPNIHPISIQFECIGLWVTFDLPQAPYKKGCTRSANRAFAMATQYANQGKTGCGSRWLFLQPSPLPYQGVDACAGVQVGHVEVQGAPRAKAVRRGGTLHQLPVPTVVQGNQSPHKSGCASWDMLVGHEGPIHPCNLQAGQNRCVYRIEMM